MVYPVADNLDGTSATQLNGNNTYKLTFLPPVDHPSSLPVVGTLPPTVNDSQGNPLGFWSIHVYHDDATQAAAPFISQATVQNTAYSSANLPVFDVDPSTDTITVQASAWGPLVASSPILFGRPQRSTVSHPASALMSTDPESNRLIIARTSKAMAAQRAALGG